MNKGNEIQSSNIAIIARISNKDIRKGDRITLRAEDVYTCIKNRTQ